MRCRLRRGGLGGGDIGSIFGIVSCIWGYLVEGGCSCVVCDIDWIYLQYYTILYFI